MQERDSFLAHQFHVRSLDSLLMASYHSPQLTLFFLVICFLSSVSLSDEKSHRRKREGIHFEKKRKKHKLNGVSKSALTHFVAVGCVKQREGGRGPRYMYRDEICKLTFYVPSSSHSWLLLAAAESIHRPFFSFTFFRFHESSIFSLFCF